MIDRSTASAQIREEGSGENRQRGRLKQKSVRECV
jgi:hypothetical protein